MRRWINLNHLKEASRAANINITYLTHLSISIREFLFCLLIAFGSLVHAIIPWVLDFKLIEWRVNRLKMLKKKFPNDPILKKVKFDE